MKARILIGVLASVTLFTSCLKDDDNEFENSLSFEFNTGSHGWTGDFADYPAVDSVFYELGFNRTKLPAPLDTTKYALMLTGNNHSDDLFMFIKREVTGLLPNTTYEIRYDLLFASKAPSNAVGVGGSPGESVGIKVGATTNEPKKVLEGDAYKMNIDKGNQSQSGADMKLIGDVAVSDTTTVFTLINRNNLSAPVTGTTDNQGSLWLIIGTESGFEATTTLYFKRIDIIIR